MSWKFDEVFMTPPPLIATIPQLRQMVNSRFPVDVVRDIDWLDEMDLKGEGIYQNKHGEQVMVVRPEYPEYAWTSKTKMRGTVQKSGEGRLMNDTREYETDEAIRPDNRCAILCFAGFGNSGLDTRCTVTEFAEWMGWKPGDGAMDPIGFRPDTTPTEIPGQAKAEIRQIKAKIKAGEEAPAAVILPESPTSEAVNPRGVDDHARPKGKPGRPRGR